MTDGARETARACVEAGVAAADPERAVRDALSLSEGVLRVGDHALDLADYDRVLVVGGGKDAAAVARGLDAVLGDRLAGGVVVTDGDAEAGRVDALPGDHPTPSERNVDATERALALLDDADERTLLLAPVTGGGSALLCAPHGDLSLDDLRATTDALLDAGVPIDGVNAVRKHLSTVKGGRAARRAAPATVLALLVSDVIGDDPAVIASGPFVPDDSTFDDALTVLDRYEVTVPARVETFLERGAAGDVAETPTGTFDRVHTHFLVTNRTALNAAAAEADARGYEPLVLSGSMRGEAREVALAHVAVCEEARAADRPVAPPAVVLSGGELTVTVRGDGSGGPNQEFALRAALDIPPGVACCSVDTDGSDGGTDAAGALVDSETVDDVDAAWRALGANDSHTYLAERDALVSLAGTNVNDLRALVVPE